MSHLDLRPSLIGVDVARSTPTQAAVPANSYVTLPGSGGAFVSTPHTADLNLTADMELIVRVYMPDFSPAANMTLLSKGTSTRRYQLSFDGTTWGVWNGATYVGKTTTILDGNTYWVRLALVGGSVSHYYAADQASIPTSWTQIGTSAAWSLGTTNTETLTIGSVGAAELLNGRVYRAIVRSSVDGTTVADFNPNYYTGGSTFTSTDGRVYTLNGTATVTKA